MTAAPATANTAGGDRFGDLLSLPTLQQALAAAGVVPVAHPKRWRPWSWEAQRRLYGRLGYIPSPGQRAFHKSARRTKVLCAGARFGKSLVAARDVLPVVLSPATNTWILGPTYDLAEKEWRYVVEDLERLGVMKLATVRQMGKPGYLEFPWGARIWTRSADNPSSLLGEELDCILLSEASQLPEKILHRYVRARLGSRLGRLLIPTTPFGFNWIRDVWQRGAVQATASGDPEADVPWEQSVASWQFSVLENPHFDAGEYVAAAEALPREEFAEQYDGRFTSMSGRVIPQFARQRHVVHTLPQRLRDCTVFRTIDFGYNDPSCCLWVVWDRSGDDAAGIVPGTFWVVGEIYERSLLTPDFARMIIDHEWSKGVRLFATYGDMADAQARAQLTHYGVPVAADGTRLLSGETVPIDKAIRAGLSTLRVLFHQGRVRIHHSCANLIRELTQYVFAEDKDEPAPNQDDHAIDPLRYLLHTIAPNGVSRR